jgi:hypothetical protein
MYFVKDPNGPATETGTAVKVLFNPDQSILEVEDCVAHFSIVSATGRLVKHSLNARFFYPIATVECFRVHPLRCRKQKPRRREVREQETRKCFETESSGKPPGRFPYGTLSRFFFA